MFYGLTFRRHNSRHSIARERIQACAIGGLCTPPPLPSTRKSRVWKLILMKLSHVRTFQFSFKLLHFRSKIFARRSVTPASVFLASSSVKNVVAFLTPQIHRTPFWRRTGSILEGSWTFPASVSRDDFQKPFLLRFGARKIFGYWQERMFSKPILLQFKTNFSHWEPIFFGVFALRLQFCIVQISITFRIDSDRTLGCQTTNSSRLRLFLSPCVTLPLSDGQMNIFISFSQFCVPRSEYVNRFSCILLPLPSFSPPPPLSPFTSLVSLYLSCLPLPPLPLKGWKTTVDVVRKWRTQAVFSGCKIW